MKPSECIIYSDIDGTYLKSWTHDAYVGPPESNVIAINRFVKEGGHFGGASGREYPGILRCFKDVTLNMPIVQNNGAIVYDHLKNEVLEAHYFTSEQKQELYYYTRKNKDVWLCSSTLDTIYDVLLNDKRDNGAFDLVRPHMSYDDFMHLNIAKAAFVVEPNKMAKVNEDIKSFNCFNELEFLQSAPVYNEIVVKGISKGVAVRNAMKYAGLSDKTLICIGDYYNDVSMLQAADIAVCPINAPDDIKKICKYVVADNNTGALADLINNILEEL